MSIKLSIKELKDILKLNKLAIKKRKRSKKRLGKAQQNQNIRSTSAHMISGGTTMMNTANEQGELIRLQRQALEDKLKEDKENRIKKEVKEKEAKEQNDLDNAGGMVPYSRLSGNGGSNNLRDEVTNQHKTLTYMMMMPGSMYFPLQGTARRETEEGAEPGNVGYASKEPRVEEPRVEELKNEKSSGGFDDGSANANAKTPGADAEVNVFDPNTLDINAAKKLQLIGWINFKRGYTDANLPNKTQSQLFFIARGIKYKEEGEADEEAFKKEQAEKAEAAQAKAEAAKAARAAAKAKAEEAARAKEEEEAEAARARAAAARARAAAKAKEEEEAARARARAKAKEEEEAARARAKEEEDEKSVQGAPVIRTIKSKFGTRSTGKNNTTPTSQKGK